MALDISQLEAEVERQTTVAAGILVLIDEIEANKGDPAAIQRVVDKVRANTDSLATKLVTNTPADPNA